MRVRRARSKEKARCKGPWGSEFSARIRSQTVKFGPETSSLIPEEASIANQIAPMRRTIDFDSDRFILPASNGPE